jgi:anaerobic selenocysteine-containing dehydrogenase
VCPKMPDGRAVFSALVPIPPQDSLTLATRRGAQFNSIVFREHDAITGSLRDEVFISSEDAGVLKLAPGEIVVLVSELGSMQARVRIEAVKPGTLQMFWPESNVLIDRRYDPVSGEPDYNAQVTIRKIGAS